MIIEHQDGISLFLIKMMGTTLTALTIFGYLDAVSNWDWLLNILVSAILLLIINLLWAILSSVFGLCMQILAIFLHIFCTK